MSAEVEIDSPVKPVVSPEVVVRRPYAPANVPLVGQKVPVTLPDEITRGEVVEVRSDDEIVVGLTLVTPMARTHTYRMGDWVVCRREADAFGGGSYWRATKKVED